MIQNIYYYHKNGKQIGPVSIDILQNMVKAKQLTQTDLVWIKNLDSYVPAESLQELFPTEKNLQSDPDQAVVYQHNETLISSGNKEDLKWYSIGGAGLFIGLILLASTSRNFSLVKTRNLHQEFKKVGSEIAPDLGETKNKISDTLNFMRNLEKKTIEETKNRK